MSWVSSSNDHSCLIELPDPEGSAATKVQSELLKPETKKILNFPLSKV